MAETEVVFKRCGCTDPLSGKRGDRRCPRLDEEGHGSWYFSCSVPDLNGVPRRVRRGGHRTEEAALQARRSFLDANTEEQAGSTWTVARWLRYWLLTRTSIRPTTRLSHDGYIEKFLVPYLGRVSLAELSTRHIAAMFARVEQLTNRKGQLTTPSTLAHIKRTLGAALNAAVRQGLLRDNPARHVEVPPYRRSRPVLWTDSRVAAWQAIGARPPLAVWTPLQLNQFLISTRNDRLHAMWWLIALRGLRRGEAAGLRWSDLDLENAELMITKSRTAAGYEVYEDAPKTDAGGRVVALDKHTVKVLQTHRRRQRAECQGEGRPWSEAGYVFTSPEGKPLHPQYLSRRFSSLVAASDLPPVRLHDLRHGAACLAHAAGADLKMIQQQLGHAGVSVTSEIYTTVLPATQHQMAKATARLLKGCAPKATSKRKGKRQAGPPKSSS